MGSWCAELLRMRVMSCASTDKLPDNIGNWKHLRYLEISRACSLKKIPSTFYSLHNMQILYAKKCHLECLLHDFGKLISLQKFETQRLTLDSDNQKGPGIRLLKKLYQFRGRLEIANAGILSKDQAVEEELKNMKYLEELKLNMGFGFPKSHTIKNEEVLEVLQPPISLKSLFLQNYRGSSLPSWFQPQNLSSLESLTFERCDGFKSINLNEMPAVGKFMSLINVRIEWCGNISSLEDFLHPAYVPNIRKIAIVGCEILQSIPTEKFRDLRLLEELSIGRCTNIRLQRLVSQSLKKLSLDGSGLFCNIDCCSLTEFTLSGTSVTSIQLQTWSLPALQRLEIRCAYLASIGDCGNSSISAGTGSIRAFLSLKVIEIVGCLHLSTLDDLLTQEYLPAIEKIDIIYCFELKSLPVERFVSFPYLKHLVVIECPNLKWQRGLVLPTYLQSLCLKECGDISPYASSCLQNLTSLVSLEIGGCNGITSIRGNIWRSNLVSLQKLVINNCPNLVSIGGAEAVANIKEVEISRCPKLEEAEQINKRPRPSTRRTR